MHWAEAALLDLVEHVAEWSRAPQSTEVVREPLASAFADAGERVGVGDGPGR